MSTKTLLWVTLLCLVAPLSIFSQSDTTRYFFKPDWGKNLEKQPQNAKRWQDFELHARMYAKYAVPEEKILPLVFNVINVGGKSKVTEQAIYEQIQVLNDAFAGKLEGWNSKVFDKVRAGDTKIRFCVGSPQGKKAAIYFTNVDAAYDLDRLADISSKKDGLEGTKKEEYINVWITDLPDELGGYALLPDRDEQQDGIYIDPDFFGIKREQKYYHSGKTLVHLMGKYLGLQPLWTDGNCGDDGIEDTPVHNAPNTRCYEGMHISTCSGYPQEMVGNFMDSNPDDCAYMFTRGQVARMHACLGDLGYRKNLLKGNKLCDQKLNETDLTNRSTVKALDFDLVPNPAQTVVEIQYVQPDKLAQVSVEVTGMNGQKMYNTTIPPLGEERGKLQLDISAWPQGQYFITLKTGKELKTKKLLTVK